MMVEPSVDEELDDGGVEREDTHVSFDDINTAAARANISCHLQQRRQRLAWRPVLIIW